MLREKFRSRDDIPRAGWFLVGTIDNYSSNFTCENCKFPHVRYVHELAHKRSNKQVRVGCVCAEHLTQDFSTPRLREAALKGRASRRMRWPTLNWKQSQKGNLFLKKQGNVIVVKRASSGAWRASYTHSDNENWIPVQGFYNSPEEAKLAAFDALYPIEPPRKDPA